MYVFRRSFGSEKITLMWSTRPSVSQYHRINSFSALHEISVKVTYRTVSKRERRDDSVSDSHTSLKGNNTFSPVLSTFLDRFW